MVKVYFFYNILNNKIKNIITKIECPGASLKSYKSLGVFL